MTSLFSAVCPSCGGEFKLAAFRVDGKRRSICRTCYRRKHRRLKAQKERQKREDRQLWYESAIAREKLVDTSMLPAMLRRIAKESAEPRHRVREYTAKIQERGGRHVRTRQGLEHQQKRVNYFDALKAWIQRDAQAGNLRPYLFYRSNTYLLAVHECRPTFEEADRTAYEGEAVK